MTQIRRELWPPCALPKLLFDMNSSAGVVPLSVRAITIVPPTQEKSFLLDSDRLQSTLLPILYGPRARIDSGTTAWPQLVNYNE